MCLLRGTDWVFIYNCSCGLTVAVPSLRQLVAGLSPRRPGFYPRSVDVDIFGEQLTRDQIFRQVSRFSSVSIIPPMLHRIFIYMLFLPKGQTSQTWEPSKSNAFSDMGENLVGNCFHILQFSGGFKYPVFNEVASRLYKKHFV